MMPSSEVRAYWCMKASMPPCSWRLARAALTSLAASSAMRLRSSARGAGALGEARHQARLVLEEVRCDLVARQRLARLGGHARVSTAVRPVILSAAV